MKLTGLSISLILSLILIFLTIHTLHAAEFKQNLFLTDRDYPFFNSPLFQQQFSQTNIGNFVEYSTDIQEQTKAVIIDYNILGEISSAAKTQMKNMLVGEEPRKVLFAMGYGVVQNFFQQYFDIKARTFAEIPQDTKNLLYATGLFNASINSDGPFVHVNMQSAMEIPPERQLENITEIIDKILKMYTAEQKKEPSKPYWRRIDVLLKPFDSGFCGKYNQSVLVEKMENDGSKEFDYWIAKVTNESVSGISTKKNKYKNKVNDTRIDMETDGQIVYSYGPGGDVSEGGTARVAIGKSGPQVSWSWSTGKTHLKNDSDMSKRFCHWIVNYNKSGNEAKSTYTWYPGLETKNPEQSPFKLKILNILEWKKGLGDEMLFRDKWNVIATP
jgi:hypothetical protein